MFDEEIIQPRGIFDRPYALVLWFRGIIVHVEYVNDFLGHVFTPSIQA